MRNLSTTIALCLLTFFLYSCSSVEDDSTSLDNDTNYYDSSYEQISSDDSIPEHISIEENQRSVEKRPTEYIQAFCLAYTFGPDACSQGVKSFGNDIPDILLSPMCSVTVSKILSEEPTLADVALSMFTAGIDKIGTSLYSSDSFIDNIFAIPFIAGSITARAITYDDCISKKLQENK